MNYIETLQDNIRKCHGCASRHIDTVTEDNRVKTPGSRHDHLVWEGQLEVFELIGHPTATKCYAWSHTAGRTGTITRYHAILHPDQAASPQDAILIALKRDTRNN